MKRCDNWEHCKYGSIWTPCFCTHPETQEKNICPLINEVVEKYKEQIINLLIEDDYFIECLKKQLKIDQKQSILYPYYPYPYNPKQNEITVKPSADWTADGARPLSERITWNTTTST